MFGCPSIPAKLSGICLAAMLCFTGCQFNNGGAGALDNSNTSKGFDLFPQGSIFNQTQEDAVINPYIEQKRQQNFTDDKTRPTVDMTKFQPKAKSSFSLFGN